MINYMKIEALVTKELRKSELKESDIFAVAAAIRVALVQYEQELKKQRTQTQQP